MLENDLYISILLNTKGPTVASFGRSLIFGRRAAQGAPSGLLGSARIYSDAADMIADGYTVNDDEYKFVSKYQSQDFKSKDFVVFTDDSAGSIEASLNLAKSQQDFYGLLATSRIVADLHSCGDWASANNKFFIGGTNDLSILTGRNNIREAYMLHSDNSIFSDASWAGLCFPQDIGSITWKWQEPSGVTVPNYSSTQLDTIRTNKGQTFENVAGYIMSNEGITTGGQYIDIIMIRDLVHARLFEDIIFAFRGGTVQLDNVGLMKIEAVMRNRFGQFGKSGIISPVVTDKDKVNSDMGSYQYILTIPDVNDISTTDVALRKATGIKFKFRASGKMHSAEIAGEIFV